MAGMKPAERAMFQESYADALARKMDAMSDRRDVTTALFNSPQERAKIGAVFGPQGVDRLQAFINREKIFDAARHALGNSTTVRQMIEAGLAGGAAGGILSGGDWHAIGEGALTGAGAGLGAAGSGLVRHGVLTGARTALGYIDRNTAARVARLLASNNPRELMEGLKMAARDKRVASRLGDMGARAAAMAGALKRPRVPLALLPGSPQGSGSGTMCRHGPGRTHRPLWRLAPRSVASPTPTTRSAKSKHIIALAVVSPRHGAGHAKCFARRGGAQPLKVTSRLAAFAPYSSGRSIPRILWCGNSRPNGPRTGSGTSKTRNVRVSICDWSRAQHRGPSAINLLPVGWAPP
jgi:hypothetical protein